MKMKINTVRAEKLQSKDLRKNNVSQKSIDELLKLCRPLKVHITRCTEISNKGN